VNRACEVQRLRIGRLGILGEQGVDRLVQRRFGLALRLAMEREKDPKGIFERILGLQLGILVRGERELLTRPGEILAVQCWRGREHQGAQGAAGKAEIFVTNGLLHNGTVELHHDPIPLGPV
jgi:hypothetical protein